MEEHERMAELNQSIKSLETEINLLYESGDDMDIPLLQRELLHLKRELNLLRQNVHKQTETVR